MSKHLVIGDPHVQPSTSNERFIKAGKVVLDYRPTTVICLGDFADMPSLSSYDRGTKSYEGRRYRQDIESVRDALGKFNRPIDEYNETCRVNKKAQYKPRKVMLGGNHEDRILRTIQIHPEMDGQIGLHDLQYEEHGWEVIPYREVIEIDGVAYCHYFPSGIKGEAVSGLNVAASLLAKHMTSCTVGHNHLFDYAIRNTPGGITHMALSAGCFFEHPQTYAAHTQYMWWRGLIIKNNVSNGVYDLETLSMEEINERY